MNKHEFDVMEACAASAKDFIDTVLFCMKDDEEEYKDMFCVEIWLDN